MKANKLAADIINKALREGSIISDKESENSLIEKELMQIEENLRNNKLYEDVEELKRKQNEFGKIQFSENQLELLKIKKEQKIKTDFSKMKCMISTNESRELIDKIFEKHVVPLVKRNE